MLGIRRGKVAIDKSVPIKILDVFSWLISIVASGILLFLFSTSPIYNFKTISSLVQIKDNLLYDSGGIIDKLSTSGEIVYTENIALGSRWHVILGAISPELINDIRIGATTDASADEQASFKLPDYVKILIPEHTFSKYGFRLNQDGTYSGIDGRKIMVIKKKVGTFFMYLYVCGNASGFVLELYHR